jgi:NADPH:quinone reductase-like Zn-dependent oxidoreductase
VLITEREPGPAAGLFFGIPRAQLPRCTAPLGDRVADMTVLGSNAAYRTLQATRLTPVPAGVDAAEAATLILRMRTGTLCTFPPL